MEQKLMRLFFLGFVIAFFISLALSNVFYTQDEKTVDTVHIDMNEFSKMNILGSDLRRIKAYCNEKDIDFYKYLSGTMLHYDFKIPNLKEKFKKSRINESDSSIEKLYQMIFEDIECFPVVGLKSRDEERYYYTDSFLAERTYGGDRKHMGTDIMDSENEGGYFNIVSMTDGIVENMGWLELGGYRVGIRSESGAYWYYAHLKDYAKNLQEGDLVEAGQLLGTMGSTGYGEEGTDDQFDVHLHMAICLNLDDEEFWVNPYAVLQMLDPKELGE